MFDFIKVMYFLCITLFAINISYAQTPDATGNFVKPEIEISTTPEFPGICSLNKGVTVTCNEDFLTYKWESLEHPTEPIIETKKAILRKTGRWKLTIKTNVDKIVCERSIEFEVFDLADPSKIQSYFENAGFYAIPIWRDDLPALRDDEIENRSGICDISQIKYDQSSTQVIDLNLSLIEVMNNFNP